MQGESEFKRELEVFDREQAVAQQYFFAWLAMRDLFRRDEKLLDRLNDTPLYWITTHHALILAAFVALGRIFDQRSRHNVDRLLNFAQKHRVIFSRQALAGRKIRDGLSPEFAQAYIQDVYEPSATDFRLLRSAVAERRRVYERGLREVRDKIFAHRELSTPDEINAVLARARIDDLKSVCGFLYALHQALWELLWNGRPPVIEEPEFRLPPAEAPIGSDIPGERVARDVSEFFKGVMNREL